jgi:hypothetical protein
VFQTDSALELKIYKYGDNLTALDANNPTLLKRERNIVLISMDLDVCRNVTGARNSVDIDVASFDTNLLAIESPKDFLTTVRDRSHTRHRRWVRKTAFSKKDIGNIRYYIQGELHPCIGANDYCDWASFDHTGHKKCFLNYDLIFVFSDKEATIRELNSLGYSLEREYVIKLTSLI